MNIKFEQGIRLNDAALLCAWSNERGAEFQEQWMGPGVPYPLSLDEIEGLENVYSILNGEEFVGVIQKVRADADNIHIGRFIINPQKTGLGLGTEALKRFMDFVFEDEGIGSISLTVLDSNRGAKRLYERLGFEVDEVIERPTLKYVMRRRRQEAPWGT